MACSKTKRPLNKYCIVPYCENTERNAQDILFLSLPKSCNRRTNWLLAMGRDPDSLSPKSTFYVCEDHFNVINFKFNCICTRISSDIDGTLFSSWKRIWQII